MKLLHISDLHLGKRVNEFSMLDDQKYILAEILDVIDAQKPTAVVIAGDIYDKPVPPAEAVQLFDEFLTSLSRREISVFIISGNHDSAERIAFGASLVSRSKVYLSPVFNGAPAPVTLSDEYGDIDFYLLPFVKPAPVRHVYSDAKIDSYNDAVKTVIENMNVDTTRRNVLVAHQFVTGATRCESEEISVGGLDNVDVNVFDVFDYVALGHIHGQQRIMRETVRYCGTPLKYSFSEANDNKCAVLVDMCEKGTVNLEKMPLTPKRDMREIKGTYMQLTAQSFYKDIPREDYYHITLTDEDDIPSVLDKLRAVYPNIMKLDYDNKRTRTSNEITGATVENKSPFEMLSEFYELQNNAPLSQQQTQLAQSAIENIWEDKQ